MNESDPKVSEDGNVGKSIVEDVRDEEVGIKENVGDLGKADLGSLGDNKEKEKYGHKSSEAEEERLQKGNQKEPDQTKVLEEQRSDAGDALVIQKEKEIKEKPDENNIDKEIPTESVGQPISHQDEEDLFSTLSVENTVGDNVRPEVSPVQEESSTDEELEEQSDDEDTLKIQKDMEIKQKSEETIEKAIPTELATPKIPHPDEKDSSSILTTGNSVNNNVQAHVAQMKEENATENVVEDIVQLANRIPSKDNDEMSSTGTLEEQIFPKEIDPLKLRVIQDKLQEACRKGSELCKLRVEGMIDENNPLTTNQIKEFHQGAQEAVVDAFAAFLPPIQQDLPPEIKKLFEESHAKLVKSTYSAELENQYVTRYETRMSQILGHFRACTNQAESMYQNQLESFEPISKLSREEIEVRHNELKKSVLAQFQQFLKERGVDPDKYSGYTHELEYKLDQSLKELLSVRLFSQDDQAPLVFTTLPRHPPRPNSSGPTLNLGMYIDETTIAVAMIDPKTYALKILLSESLDIGFLENQVLIGDKVRTSSNPQLQFQLHELIKSENGASHLLTLGSFAATITTEEIIGLYFSQLLSRIPNQENLPFGQIIITTGFSCSSYEKERILMAVRMVGLKYIRLLSSPLTTIISYTSKQEQEFSQTSRNIILVVHSLVRSFTMAILDIHPGAIKTLAFYSSSNTQGDDFERDHSLLATNTDDKKMSKAFSAVLTAYRQATQQVLAGGNCPIAKMRKVACVSPGKNNLFQMVVAKLFQSCTIVHFLPEEGPLLGACTFASPHDFFMDNFNVYDYTSSRFYLYVDNELTMSVNHKEFGVCGDSPPYKLAVEGNQLVNVLVVEETHGRIRVTCQYQVSAEPETEGSTCVVTLAPRVDMDGIYNVLFDIADAKKGSILRLDHVLLHSPGKIIPRMDFLLKAAKEGEGKTRWYHRIFGK